MTEPTQPKSGGHVILTTAHARFTAHIAVAFCAAFFPMYYAAGATLDKSVLIAAIAAGARAALGATTSTNPNVGKNVV
jgi:hypothetical protein